MTRPTILITGTDTGIGKTTVSCVLAAGMRSRGQSVGVFKPAETGCPAGADGDRLPQDALKLKYFSACALPVTELCAYRLRDPLAPMVAARREGVSISLDHIVACHDQIQRQHDVTLVEGAGGLLVPITQDVTFVDLARRLQARLLVVVGNRLGGINHALLTLQHARGAGLDVAGYILNTISHDDDLATESNVAVLEELAGPSLGVVPFIEDLKMTPSVRDQLAHLALTCIRWDQLFA